MRRSRRRRKKNPAGSLVLISLAVVAAGGVAFFLLEKNAKANPKILTSTTGTQFATTPAFTGGIAPALFAQIRAGDCVTAVQGQAGFGVPGVPDGQNVVLRVTAVGSGSVQAVSQDPRTPSDLPPVTITAQMVSGAGDC